MTFGNRYIALTLSPDHRKTARVSIASQPSAYTFDDAIEGIREDSRCGFEAPLLDSENSHLI